MPAPGEQHGLGLRIVSEFMRRAGWQVWCGAPESRAVLLDMVRQEWFALIGFSTACTNRLESLETAVRLVRRASRNPAIGVMVGGPVFIDHPELATEGDRALASATSNEDWQRAFATLIEASGGLEAVVLASMRERGATPPPLSPWSSTESRQCAGAARATAT